MIQFKRVYIAGLAATLFFALLLLLAQHLPREPRLDAIEPLRWPLHMTWTNMKTQIARPGRL